MIQIDKFKTELVTVLTEFLKQNVQHFSNDEMYVLDLGCFPWSSSLELSFLTIDEAKYYGNDKFEEIADWKYYAFNHDVICSPEIEVLESQIGKEYEISEGSTEFVSQLLKVCAEALSSKEVITVLNLYKLSPDFRCTVFNPDDGNFSNLCEESI